MKQIEFDLSLSLQSDSRSDCLLAKGELDALRGPVEEAACSIEAGRGKGNLAFLELPYAYDEEHGPTNFGDLFVRTKHRFSEIRERVSRSDGQYIHIGIGGSALGAATLANAIGQRTFNGPHIPNNIDPDTLGALLDQLDPTRVFANVVSQSGNTVETVATYAVLRNFLAKSGLSNAAIAERISFTTDPAEGALRDLAISEGAEILPLPSSIHGRFSVFAPTGLFTAAAAGADIDGLLAGARWADGTTRDQPFWSNPAKLLAALHFACDKTLEASCLVLMPYSDRLCSIADWYSQLVAESLGKGGRGITPVKALGVTDQHSQLQLYNDGPKNKLVVMFSLEEFSRSIAIPDNIGRSFSYLQGHSINDLLEAERKATEVSLHLNGVPSCGFRLPRLDAFHLGALLVILEKTVCILGLLYGVNAFDQPGVEESKAYARAMLGEDSADSKELLNQLSRVLARSKKVA